MGSAIDNRDNLQALCNTRSSTLVQQLCHRADSTSLQFDPRGDQERLVTKEARQTQLSPTRRPDKECFVEEAESLFKSDQSKQSTTL